MGDIKTTVERNRYILSLEKIQQDLFYIFCNQGQCSLNGYSKKSLILIPKMIVDRLELFEKQLLYVQHDIGKDFLRFSKKPKNENDYIANIIVYRSRLYVVLSKQLCLDFNLITNQMLFIFYLSSNDFFSCKKSCDMLLYQ